MTARYFVDSNVIIYARDFTEREKQQRAAHWLNRLWDAGGSLSYQVLVESFSVLTSRHRMAPEQARAYVQSFFEWQPLSIDRYIMEHAWQIQDRFKLNWWDSLIVSAAQLAECDYLLTEDLHHGQDLDGIIVVNPFEVSPEEAHP